MYFLAKIDSNNVVVETFDIDQDSQNLSESELIVKFALSGNWKKADKNTLFGTNSLGVAFRKNCPQIGFSYDEVRDAFIWPKRHESWILNEETCDWDAPITMPTDGYYFWNEEAKNWEKTE